MAWCDMMWSWAKLQTPHNHFPYVHNLRFRIEQSRWRRCAILGKTFLPEQPLRFPTPATCMVSSLLLCKPSPFPYPQPSPLPYPYLFVDSLRFLHGIFVDIRLLESQQIVLLDLPNDTTNVELSVRFPKTDTCRQVLGVLAGRHLVSKKCSRSKVDDHESRTATQKSGFYIHSQCHTLRIVSAQEMYQVSILSTGVHLPMEFAPQCSLHANHNARLRAYTSETIWYETWHDSMTWYNRWHETIRYETWHDSTTWYNRWHDMIGW